MQRISVAAAKPGMEVARDIISADGRMLLRAGIILTASYIRRLREMGVASLYIKNPLLAGVDVSEVISEQTRLEAIRAVKTAFINMQKNHRLDISRMRDTAKVIVDEVILNRHSLIHLTDIRAHDDYTFAHSVSVCVLSAMLAVQLGYHEGKLRELALGALLHDLGKRDISPDILNKPGKLTSEEFDLIKKHPEQGFAILRKKSAELSLLSMHVAFQHHEKFDGSGYPRGLKGAEIHEYARIVAIADVYDALTSDRPYRQHMMPHEAYELMMASTGTHFDPMLLESFLNNIAIYPVGTVVELNTGEVGVVVNVKRGLQTRPSIKLIKDNSGKVCTEEKIIDLTVQLTAFIIRVLNEEEIFALGQQTAAKVG